MGLLDWVDPTREWFKGRPEAVKGLLGAVYQMATDPQAREAAMARYPVFDRSQSGQQMIDNAMNAGPSGLLGKIVYHGSPHKFDKFDASKIGTGEGAQAYGHGVYLADSENVGRQYANELGSEVSVNGKVILRNNKKAGTTGDPAIDDHLIGNLGDIDKAIAEAMQYKDPELPRLLELKKSNAVKVTNSGALYKADLPDEWIPKMLDWDKPLKEQPEVLTALQKSGYLDEARKAGGFYESDVASGLMEGRHLLPAKPSAGGRDIAERLRASGIPGIRYLDGGSRSAGKGSYNYVVFPGLEDQVKILERNGVPLTGLLGR